MEEKACGGREIAPRAYYSFGGTGICKQAEETGGVRSPARGAAAHPTRRKDKANPHPSTPTRPCPTASLNVPMVNHAGYSTATHALSLAAAAAASTWGGGGRM